ncbi:LemA family protein [Blattabacterium cuenoti]|uniref:LemA family protein n=1 Tax=Blattabacterium cuenoti TaxID=1653831 RepID=UPI00163D1AB8|nr:LemA family protein [Blattabacterium cuenoti]
MKKYFFNIIISIIIFFTIIGLWSISIYNNLILLNEKIKNQWGQVENVYQRRLDLIPNLVNTVKGAASFENKTLTQIVEARSKANSIQLNSNELDQNQINKFEKTQENLNNYVGKLLVVVENYPDIKSTKNFSELQNQLEGTENRINVERNRFNEQVGNFNTYRNQFPKIIIANFFDKFKEKGYFKSQNGSNKSPLIDFSHY